MLKTMLQVIAVGEPDIETISDTQKHAFFETLFSKIVELYKETQNKVVNNAEQRMNRYTKYTNKEENNEQPRYENLL